MKLLAETRRVSRLTLAPYLFLEVARDDKGQYQLNVVNESTALAVQVDCFIYDAVNKHYIQFVQLTHSKPEDEDVPERLPAVASRQDATARVKRRNPGAPAGPVEQLIDCGSRSAAIAVFQDAEQRLYATRRFFSEQDGKIVHIKQQRVLLANAVDGDEQLETGF